MKIIDFLGISLIVLGIAMTVLNFNAREPRCPRAELAPHSRGNNL